ncbi:MULTISPECIES: type II toxin-antitoxin system HicA family toxin [Cysteiniphilum]|uniref:type II toxin-antitoxin system HicA family toxin n=1 Tax=Cysteiniphilum TaxID=2056696 RepID=UPI001247E2A8|nr:MULTISPECIES: type II toxin-antitoxin system HicA family toxin [Cysteiniphilum]WHN64800.1 type II toxin-antitoxin system HicA family toxin [Cysteiniphilum sp. QT6929]
MTKIDKALEKLLACPKDLTWAELSKVLKSFGFSESNAGKTSGSRVRFYLNKETPPLMLHKPHPKPTLKEYQIKNVIEYLKKVGLI